MLLLWHFYWPAVAIAFLAGVAAGWAAWRRRSRSSSGAPTADQRKRDLRTRRRTTLALGFLAAAIATGLWHGPASAGARFATAVETSARAELQRLEMPSVSARLARGPLSRRMILNGGGDDFQRTELVRIMSARPGVGTATWRANGGFSPPLVAEALLLSSVAFLLGVLLAYLLERRRRAQAEWSW
jgi:membrane protease YdiL (CAAX protease family)